MEILHVLEEVLVKSTTMFKRQWETEINQKIKKNAEHRFAGSKKVVTKKNDESKNSNGPERLQYQDSSDDSD